MLIVTANIRNNPDMRPAWVSDDARLVRRLGPALVGWQEIGELEDKAALDAAFTPDRYALAGRGTPVPTTVDIDVFDVLAAPREVSLSSGSRRLRQPGRWAVVTDLEERRRGLMVRHINCHLTNGAWNGSHPDDEEERQARWLAEFGKVQDLVKSAVAQDWTVVLTGDFNRARKFPRVHPRLRWVAGAASIDRIGLVPSSGWIVRAHRTGVVHGHTDHGVRWAQVAVVKGSDL